MFPEADKCLLRGLRGFSKPHVSTNKTLSPVDSKGFSNFGHLPATQSFVERLTRDA
jgi:hypothetical protein